MSENVLNGVSKENLQSYQESMEDKHSEFQRLVNEVQSKLWNLNALIHRDMSELMEQAAFYRTGSDLKNNQVFIKPLDDYDYCSKELQKMIQDIVTITSIENRSYLARRGLYENSY